jgi:molybdopterin-dependent oxidoreductase alpha subunit
VIIMASKAPREGINEAGLKVGRPKTSSVGVPAVVHALKIAQEQMGPVRAAKALLAVNQVKGFDCPGCAFPESEKRSHAEFCENGAKAVAEEATRRRVTPSFFAEHSVAELRQKDDFWLGQQGRLTHPMLLDDGGTHYRPVSWDEAFAVIEEELRGLDSPDEAIFYTSGRTSNEAAFAYQLLVRGFGTNNLPDCSNMCHESSGYALTATIGIGKGSVSLQDLYDAELILIAGQNPGGNHPRMLTALEKAKQNGATIVAINPLPEAGWQEFHNPQTVHGLAGSGTQLADDYLPIRIGGDQALFQALGKLLLEAEEAAPGTVFDRDFLDARTTGLDAYLDHVRALDWAEIFTATGLAQAQIRGLVARLLASKATIVTWAMGLTQHKHAVATLRDIVNVLLLQGNIGRPGAGVCPVRGHSNVQGDRTMGIFEQMPAWFHDALDAEFRFTSPRARGYDTVGAIRAMRDGKAKVFICMGGHPGHPRHRGSHHQHAADGADLHQAQQIPRHHRPAGPDPTHARAHRPGHPGQRGPARHGGGLYERRTRLAWPAGTARPRPALRGGHRLPARPADLRRRQLTFRDRRAAGGLGGHGRGLFLDPTAHRACHPRI